MRLKRMGAVCDSNNGGKRGLSASMKLSLFNTLQLSPPEECNPLRSAWWWPLHQSTLSLISILHVLGVLCDAFIIPHALIFLETVQSTSFRHYWFCVMGCTISIQGKRKETFNNLILILTDLIYLKLSIRSFTLCWDWVKSSFFCKMQNISGMGLRLSLD